MFLEQSLMIALSIVIILLMIILTKVLDVHDLQDFYNLINHVIYYRNHQHWITNLFQVKEDSQRNGGELVAAILKTHDVHEIFTLCGGHISPILVAAHTLGIRIFDTRHEATAVFAAQAVAHLRQSIGVAVVTAGPGITNTVTAIKNAQIGEAAVLLIGGAAPQLAKGRGALQEIDQIALMRPICKYVARVTRVKNIISVLKDAIYIARSGVPGPVFVELPIDILYPYRKVYKELGVVKKPCGFKQTLINAYLIASISQQFGGDWYCEDLVPKIPRILFPRNEDIKELFYLLQSKEKPVLILGSQAVLPPITVYQLKAAVEKIGIPTYLSGLSRGLLGCKSSIQMRHNRREVLKNADLIILAGAICDFRLSYGRNLSGSASIVSINRDRKQMLKNHGIFWKATLAIHGDVATALFKLQNYIETTGYQHSFAVHHWITVLQANEMRHTAEICSRANEMVTGSEINPLHALSMINKELPEKAILVADGGDFIGSAAYTVYPRGPLQWLDPGPFGTLGAGGGFALGAKAVYPNRPVVILYGDGACGFSLMEFDTFVRHNLNVIAFIGNDACWSQIAREQIKTFGSTVAVNLAPTRYDKIALGFGARGELIAATNELTEERLKRIFTLATIGNNSVIVNIMIGQTDFRDGSISV